MIKKIKKTIAFVSMSLVMTMIPVNSVFAVEYGPENSLMSLAQIGPDGEPTFASPDKVIRDTYWADLEEKTLTNINGKEYPAYCLDAKKIGAGEKINKYDLDINKQIDNNLVYSMIINGYPYKSLEELRCKNRSRSFYSNKTSSIYSNIWKKYR